MFTDDLRASELLLDPPTLLTDLVRSYNTTLSSLLDEQEQLSHVLVYLGLMRKFDPQRGNGGVLSENGNYLISMLTFKPLRP